VAAVGALGEGEEQVFILMLTEMLAIFDSGLPPINRKMVLIPCH